MRILDNEAINGNTEEFYRLMNGNALKGIDEIIYAVCVLYRIHEKTGFEEDVKVGIRLAQEISIA